jgi:hypothetical protein
MAKKSSGETTSKKAGTSGSKVLRDDRTGKDSKSAAGSALTQRPNKGGGKSGGGRKK